MTIPKNFKDRERLRFVESPTRPNETAVEIVGSVSTTGPFGYYDKVAASYPTATREIYTYSLSSTLLGTITVDYTDSTKKYLSQAVYNGA